MNKIRVVALSLAMFGLMSAAYGSTEIGPTEQSIASIDVMKVERFCDVGFRFTKNSIEFNIEKLIKAGVKIDPKVLATVESQAAVQLAILTLGCRMLTATEISPNQFMGEIVKPVLQYAVDLEALRVQVEKQTSGRVSPAPDDRLDPKQVAEHELNIQIEAAVEVDSGDLTVVLRKFTQRYLCQCKRGQ